MTAAGLDCAVRRPVRARPRRLGPAGDRGLPRRAVRRAARPHPRDHRDLPQGLAPRAARARRPIYTHPAARGSGHRAGQAAQDHHPPGPRADPDLRGLARPEERRDDRRDRRRLAADPLHPRAGRATCGARRSPRARPSAPPTSARSRSSPAAWWPSATTPTQGLRDFARPMVALYVGGMGAKGKNFYNDARLPLRLRGRGRADPGPVPRRQEGRGRGDGPRRVPRGAPTSSAPRAT